MEGVQMQYDIKHIPNKFNINEGNLKKIKQRNLILSPMGGGASEAPLQHFCDFSGTVIAGTLKFFDFF